MDGKTKAERRIDLIYWLRDLADMLEDDSRYPGPGYIVVDDDKPIEYPGASPRQNGGHSPSFANDVDKPQSMMPAMPGNCPLWDDGSCGQKAATGYLQQLIASKSKAKNVSPY